MTDFVDYIEQPCLTKAHLAAQLREEMGITMREAREIVDSFFSLITERLARGEDVKIANFGNFELRQKVARPGRNPRTGEAVLIKSRRTVKFFASDKRITVRQVSSEASRGTGQAPRRTATHAAAIAPASPAAPTPVEN